jgi:hypothetical protein
VAAGRVLAVIQPEALYWTITVSLSGTKVWLNKVFVVAEEELAVLLTAPVSTSV